jgi:hypothetical protein
LQLQIYIKPQDEHYIRELQAKIKRGEVEGIRSMSEMILTSLKAYGQQRSSSIDSLDTTEIERLIDDKVERKLKELGLPASGYKSFSRTRSPRRAQTRILQL